MHRWNWKVLITKTTYFISTYIPQEWKNVYTVYQITATVRYNSIILWFLPGYWYSRANISGHIKHFCGFKTFPQQKLQNLLLFNFSFIIATNCHKISLKNRVHGKQNWSYGCIIKICFSINHHMFCTFHVIFKSTRKRVILINTNFSKMLRSFCK